jgi:hypothetical protein
VLRRPDARPRLAVAPAARPVPERPVPERRVYAAYRRAA